MMTQPSSTLNTGLSLQNDVCTWARVTANTLDFLFRPVQRPLKMFPPPLSGCFWCCHGGSVDIRVHAPDISIVFKRTTTSWKNGGVLFTYIPTFFPVRVFAGTSDQISRSDLRFRFAFAGELNMDDAGVSTRPLPVLQMLLVHGFFLFRLVLSTVRAVTNRMGQTCKDISMWSLKKSPWTQEKLLKSDNVRSNLIWNAYIFYLNFDTRYIFASTNQYCAEILKVLCGFISYLPVAAVFLL